jgi:hypothetical protein
MNPEETRAAIEEIFSRLRLGRSTSTETDSSSNTAYQSNDIPIFLSFSKPIFPAQQEFIRNLSDGLKAFGMKTQPPRQPETNGSAATTCRRINFLNDTEDSTALTRLMTNPSSLPLLRLAI